MNQRLLWLDVAKGLTIILMVIGHTSIPVIISNWIWAFHMPLFFIASGLTTNWQRDDFFEFLVKKVRNLLYPFIGYSIVLILLILIFGIEHNNIGLKIGWGGFALWFVPVLFVGLLLAKMYFCINGKWRIVYFAVLPIISGILCFYHVFVPWNLASAPFAAMFLILGSLMKCYISRMESLSKWWIMLLCCVTLFISHFWNLDMCYNNVLPILPQIVGALTGTLFIFLLSIVIHKHLKYVSSILQRIGKETFLILAFSQVIIMIFNEYFDINVGFKYLMLVGVLLIMRYIRDSLHGAYVKIVNN